MDPADTPFYGSEASQATSELGEVTSIEEQIRVLLSEMTKKVEEHVSSKAKGQDMDHTLRREHCSAEKFSVGEVEGEHDCRLISLATKAKYKTPFRRPGHFACFLL